MVKRIVVAAPLAAMLLILLSGVVLRLTYPEFTHRIIHKDITMRLKHVFGAATVLIAAHSQPGLADGGPVPPTAIGINLSVIGPGYFANAAIGNDWFAVTPKWIPLSPANQTADGGVASLPAGASAALILMLPDTGPKGATIGCTWAGRGMMIARGTVTGMVASANSLHFSVTSTQAVHANVWLQVGSVNPQDPIRHIDCRETKVPPNVVFNPALVRSLKGFKTIRFMDWQRTNNNVTVTWESRNKPTGIGFAKADGVPVEIEMALANEVGADPWFCMPWNADAGYVEHFALYVHDHLPPGRRVYVETGNEIWNIGFSAAKQATAEGVAEGLSSDRGTANLYRYAEKTTEVMKIWSRVFADQPKRLVRVAATQQAVPARADSVLGFRDTAAHVDTLATSAYFGTGVGHEDVTDNLNDFFERFGAGLDISIAAVVANEAVAKKYGKGYAAYEAGQSLVAPWNIPLLQKIERDPRMFIVYKKFIDEWRQRVGGPLTLFNNADTIRSGGAWGLLEYNGQPLADAPKMRAVEEELAK